VFCPGYLFASTSVTATKTCIFNPCTIGGSPGPITINYAQTIQWSANYTGTTPGNSFYLTTSSAANAADIPLSTSLITGANNRTSSLGTGTYYISINLPASQMGPGVFTVTFDPSSTGEPHIRTVNGGHYDFQAVGEFVLLKQPERQEIQVR